MPDEKYEKLAREFYPMLETTIPILALALERVALEAEIEALDWAEVRIKDGRDILRKRLEELGK